MTPSSNFNTKAKKIAVSSFILPPEEGKQKEEELLPDKACWDASAIEPPIEIAESILEKENKPGKPCLI